MARDGDRAWPGTGTGPGPDRGTGLFRDPDLDLFRDPDLARDRGTGLAQRVCQTFYEDVICRVTESVEKYSSCTIISDCLASRLVVGVLPPGGL